jgi:putative selenate reductase molybdopterin-binding subunit
MTTPGRASMTLEEAKVTGAGRFPGDVDMAQMLHAAVLRSPVPHGTVRPLDLTAAWAEPGVVTILTREDMARGARVRCVGDVVAAVAAETPEAAVRAVGRLRADIAELAVHHDPVAAIGSEPVVDPRHPDNVALEDAKEVGDFVGALERADRIVEGTYTTGRFLHANLSRRCCIARERSDGVVEVLTSVDSPVLARKELAEQLGRLPGEVAVVLSDLLTSSFGGRSSIGLSCEPVAAHLALRTAGRPVRLLYTPEEELTATHTRHWGVVRLRAGVTADGVVEALDADALVDHGCYPNFVARIVLANIRDRVLDLLPLVDYRFRGRAVLTNNPVAGEMRGIGTTQGMYVVGCHVDAIACELGLPAEEVWLRNARALAEAGRDPDGSLERCLREILRRHPESAVGRTSRVQGDLRRGTGISAGVHTTGLGTFHGPDRSHAVAETEDGGGIRVLVPAPDSGQGSNQAYATIAAAELGIPSEAVRVEPLVDGSLEDLWGSVASRGARVVGGAVRAAAVNLRDEAVERFAVRRGVARALLTADSEGLRVDGERIGWPDVFAEVGALRAEGRSEYEGAPPTYSATWVEATVDVGTGQVEVERAVVAADVGWVVDETQCRGQVEGAFAMGVEMALGTGAPLDHAVPTARDLTDFAAVRAREVPDVDVVLLESAAARDAHEPRGIGTPALPAVAPAIANAVSAATGRRVRGVPIGLTERLDFGLGLDGRVEREGK